MDFPSAFAREISISFSDSVSLIFMVTVLFSIITIICEWNEYYRQLGCRKGFCTHKNIPCVTNIINFRIGWYSRGGFLCIYESGLKKNMCTHEHANSCTHALSHTWTQGTAHTCACQGREAACHRMRDRMQMCTRTEETENTCTWVHKRTRTRETKFLVYICTYEHACLRSYVRY